MKSIRAKIITLLLCCVIFSSAVIAAICVNQTSSILQSTTRDTMVLLCEKNARTLNTTFDNIESSVNTLAHYVVENLPSTDLLKNPNSAAYQDYLVKIDLVGFNHATSLSSVAAVYVVFNPDLYGSQGYLYVGENDTWTSKPVSAISTLAQTNPAWWNTPVQTEKSAWIDADYRAENNAPRYFSYVVPMYYNGVLLGVAGMDFSYALLHEMVADIRIMETGFATVLDQSKHVIAHPSIAEGSLVGEQYQDQMFAEIKKQYLNSREDTFEDGKYNLEKALGQQLFSYEQNGETRMMTLCVLKNGMTLCLSAPKHEIYAEQYEMINSTIAIVLLVSILSIIIALLFANRLTTPIIALNKAARRFADGDLESAVDPTSKDEIGELTKILEITRIRLRDSLDELYREAHIDTLTGTHNKAAFTDAQENLTAQIKDGCAAFSVALFDVNYLKIINDTFGHIAGDELLQKIAACIKTVFGPQNTFRVGGDEFAALVYTEIESEGFERATECMAMIVKQKLENYPDVPISCAMGVAFYTQNDPDFEAVLARADQAMYQHKAIIKKETPFWHKDLQAMRRVQIEHYLEFLSILSQSMEAYPFLFDITANKNWFFNNVQAKYPVCAANSRTNTIEDMLSAVHPDDREALTADLQRISDGTQSEHNMNYRWITHDGTMVWINCHGKVINDNEGKPFLMIGRVSDTVLLPWYNTLTGLFNKAKFALDFRQGTTPDFRRFVLINIDNLSYINIKHGQEYGDRMLKLLADVLANIFPNNVLYHMEKDYFALLLPMQKESKIRTMIEKIQVQIEKYISISVAVVPNEARFHMDADSLYEHARHLLKSNKTAGGGTISFFTGEDFAHTISDLELAEELEDSVYESNYASYHLCYQPQVDARTREVVACEALLRYTSPTRGNVPPTTFIPILERTQLICEVGLWVLETAIKQCVEWRRSRPDLHISVNVSPTQLKDEALADTILSLLAQNGLPANALKLELTETAELVGAAYLQNFTKLRTAGVHISIDDFGTGYANLAYLKKIHADELKVDRLFIKDLKQGSYHYALINSIASFARDNSLRLCMEGVETVSELAVVELIDPDLLQGYLFDKPLPADKFEARYILPAAPQEWSFTDALKQERDRVHFAYFDVADILSKVQIGLWTMQLDKEEQKGKIFSDEITRKLLGINTPISPSSCFKYVMNHMCENELERVVQMISAMAETNDVVQLEYDWIHPTQGKIRMRCTGKFTGEKNGIMTFEGFLRTLSNHHNVTE